MTAYLEELRTEREMKDQFMAHHAESPFITGRVDGFHGLRYFPPAPRFRIHSKLIRSDVPSEAFLRTNRDGQATMRYLGDLSFKIGREAFRLRVYHAGEGVGTSAFIPFRDLTSGRESYGPGRYLTLELNEADEYELDFNRAFNPYCAYTDAFECPFPPVENDLAVAIRAGERTWSKEWTDAPPAAKSSGRPRQRRTTARRAKPEVRSPRFGARKR